MSVNHTNYLGLFKNNLANFHFPVLTAQWVLQNSEVKGQAA